ncbi:MAG: hypothetical protein WC897_04935 [Candidatus Gracilibacteria bacterium]
MQYVLQTGHGKGLAKTEIISILGEVVIDEVEDGFVLDCQIEDPVMLIDRMGGIVRITQVLQSGPSAMPLNFEEWVVVSMKNEIKPGGKIRFGLSMHPKSEKILKKILINSKKNLKPFLGNVRFVNKDFQNLSSVQAWHEDLISEGAIELHLFQGAKKWYLTKTLAIQDFEWYSHRDYNRPAKDSKNGMLPPKLAQILINLAEQKEGAEIYDPFCGSGTVLEEALLIGYTASGSDLSERCVEDTEINLKWLQGQIERALPSFRVFQKDANKITKNDLPKVDFAIVSETALGPNLSKVPAPETLKQIQDDLETLYEAFFSNLKKIVSEPVTMIFTAPYHRDGNERIFLPNLHTILNKYTKVIPLSEHDRPSLFYERKDQFVSREIWKVII